MTASSDSDEDAMRQVIFAVGTGLRFRRPDAAFWFDLSRAGEVWQIDVWRGASLEMRQRGSLDRLARGLNEWADLVE